VHDGTRGRKGVRMTRTPFGLVLLAGLVAAAGSAQAMTLTGDTNIVELLQQSNDIVVGQVASVTDGLDAHGVPYTEVTLDVTESIRGAISGSYKFRQFGLLAPRLTADGKRKMMPAPEGFPRYSAGDELVLMLRPSAKLTGFRMPAGVTGGKFRLTPGRAENEHGNAGLFRNVRLQKEAASTKDARMMAVDGPANPETFLSFLRRAVSEHWVETGKLARADGRRDPGITLPTEPVGVSASPRSKAPAATPQAPTQDPNANNAIPGGKR